MTVDRSPARPETVIREALGWITHEPYFDTEIAEAEDRRDAAVAALAVLLAERDEREQALREAELQLWELDKVARSECDDPFAVVKTLAFAVRMGISKALAGGVRSADAGSGGDS